MSKKKFINILVYYDILEMSQTESENLWGGDVSVKEGLDSVWRQSESLS